ncbi:hypothetical protein [Ruminococcus flavefaciens]|uniref:hypothetical protein n=1 Tax=Ruminococcus flavefaciens TaxID=1265 RepID=UPI00048D7D07|nr:hypothetical protein [Ruminococcus flavefaciens]
MKDYKDIAHSVFRRRDEYLKEKKRKREVFMKRSAVALSCCLMMLVGFNIWRTDSLKTIAPSPDKSQFNVTEANTTAPPTTDENGNTGIPVTTAVTVTTAHNGNSAAQNGTTVTTVSGENAPAVTTTHKKNSSGAVEPPLPTTFSFMEVTAVRRTTAVTTTTDRTTTTTQHKGAESSKTTARTTSTAPRTARTTTLTTVQPDIRTSRTTTAAYTTTTWYYTTSVAYTTTIATTSFNSDVPEPATTTQDIHPSPVVTETPTVTTTIATSITGFHYNGNYYKTTGTVLHEGALAMHRFIGTEYDEFIDKYFNIYTYNDHIDPNLMCYAYVEGNYAYLGINEVWKPETFGDLLDGIDADSNLKPKSFYDTASNEMHSLFDVHTVHELLDQYRDKKLEITGLSYGAQCVMLQNAGEKPPELDLSNKQGYIAVELPYSMSNSVKYLGHGYIHITDDGKLEVDLLYLKYSMDIGKDDAEELVNRLKTL